MTQPNGMPDNPGDPEVTDDEATSADRAESAEAEAAADPSTTGEATGAPLGDDPAAEAVVDDATDVDSQAAAQAATDAAEDEALDEAEQEEDSETADLQAQLAERTEDLQRLNAEYTNYRRRTERERQAVIDNAKGQVLSQFLPVLDDLELARKHGDLDEGPLKAISDKLQGVLDSQNLTPFGEEGEKFNPEVHEAVQDLSSGDDKVIGTVLRRGYRVGEKLVRNALVIIDDPKDADAGSDSHNDDSQSAGSSTDSE